MDITSSNLRAHDATCAFPSWPRRSSLTDSDGSSSRPTSFLSDDDLFFSCPDPFSEDSDAASTPSPSLEIQNELEREVERQRARQLERERLQREQYVRQAIIDKETQKRRQQLAMRRSQLPNERSKKGSPKKHPKSKLSSMTPIAENMD